MAAIKGSMAAAMAILGMNPPAFTAPDRSLTPVEQISLDALSAFDSPPGNWQVAGGIGGDARREKNLTALAGAGILMNLPHGKKGGDIFTRWRHGDMDLDLDFLMPAGSNSGIYLQGRYEVQLLDSWGVKAPTFRDCGGIYCGTEESSGHVPRANASRAPGLWQHMRIEFRAPRFDSKGRKVRNARFARVVLNGFTIHEDVELFEPTRGSAFPKEGPLGPLRFQGDHGGVAFRAIRVRRYGAHEPRLDNLSLAFHSGRFKSVSDYETRTPTRTAALTAFEEALTEDDGRGAVVVTGTFIAPVAGDYLFNTQSDGPVRLLLDGKLAIEPAEEEGGQPRRIPLTAGAHAVRLDILTTNAQSLESFDLLMEGAGVAPQRLLARPVQSGPGTALRTREVAILDPKDRMLVQRGFVPSHFRQHLYAVSVGSPSGAHYAYDLESAALLRVWRGGFLDVSEMWVNRGHSQQALPRGPALTLNDKPALAQLVGADDAWPAAPDQLASSRGYRLDEPSGQPVFLYEVAGVHLEDRITANADARGITRELKLTGKPWDTAMSLLLAEGDTITAQPGGGYIVGDREYYVDWPKDAALTPILRFDAAADKQQLVVRLPEEMDATTVTYAIVW